MTGSDHDGDDADGLLQNMLERVSGAVALFEMRRYTLSQAAAPIILKEDSP